MRHLVWGVLGLLIGGLFLFSALAVSKAPDFRPIIYGLIFVVFGIYRINKYLEEKKQAGENSRNLSKNP
jgi:hypothetical protein